MRFNNVRIWVVLEINIKNWNKLTSRIGCYSRLHVHSTCGRKCSNLNLDPTPVKRIKSSQVNSNQQSKQQSPWNASSWCHHYNYVVKSYHHMKSNHVKSCQITWCRTHDCVWHHVIYMIWRQLCNQIVSPATTTYINVNGQVRDSLHEERCRFVVKGEFHTSTTHQHFSSCKHPWPLHSCRHPAMQIKSTYMSERVRDCLHEERCRCVVKGEFHTRTHQHLPWTLALMQTLMQIKSSQVKSIKSSQVKNQISNIDKYYTSLWLLVHLVLSLLWQVHPLVAILVVRWSLPTIVTILLVPPCLVSLSLGFLPVNIELFPLLLGINPVLIEFVIQLQVSGAWLMSELHRSWLPLLIQSSDAFSKGFARMLVVQCLLLVCPMHVHVAVVVANVIPPFLVCLPLPVACIASFSRWHSALLPVVQMRVFCFQYFCDSHVGFISLLPCVLLQIWLCWPFKAVWPCILAWVELLSTCCALCL